MALCANRPEEFGPRSALHSTLPTTCFEDAILVPLATWIFLFLVLALLLPHTFRPRSSHHSERARPTLANRIRGDGSFFRGSSTPTSVAIGSKERTTSGNDPSDIKAVVQQQSGVKSRHKLELLLVCLYYFLVFAMLAMISLEIARQATAQIGIGLLPFNFIGTLGAMLIHVSSRTKLSRGVAGSFWLLLGVFMAIKVATYAKEGRQGFKRDGAIDGAPLDMYKVSDQITDDGTMVGVAVILFALEAIGVFCLHNDP